MASLEIPNVDYPAYDFPRGMPNLEDLIAEKTSKTSGGIPGGIILDLFRKIICNHLQTALILETYTIPMYLFAAYSIKTPNDDKKKILAVSRDEMLHQGFVGNMISALGGTPRLYEYTPQFPRKLFYTELALDLKPASKDTIQLFVKVEAPEPTQIFLQQDTLLPNYGSIGKFYEGLEKVIKLADDFAKSHNLNLFLDTKSKQLDSSAKGLLFPITDLKTANDAIKLIVEQGEGSPGHVENSHYEAFKKMYDNYRIEYYDVVENIDSANHTNEKFHPVMVASDAAYSYLFLSIEKLWQYADRPGGPKRSDVITHNFHEAMRDVIRPIAIFLVQQKITSGVHAGKYAGPPFRRYNFPGQGTELEKLKRCIKAAVDAYPEESSLKDAQKVVDEDLIDLSLLTPA